MIKEKQMNPEQALSIVSFKLGKEFYGQDIRYVSEVNRIEEVTEMPGSPEYIIGVINLRGNVIPVMDIRSRLGLKPIEFTKKSRAIVVEYENSQLGLAVDSVQYVNEISLKEINAPPEQAVTDRNRFLMGIGHIDNRLVFIIDISKIFAEEKGKSVETKEFSQISS